MIGEAIVADVELPEEVLHLGHGSIRSGSGDSGNGKLRKWIRSECMPHNVIGNQG